MEPLPSRSSRGSKASPDAPPHSGGSDTSRPSTSSSQLDALSGGLGRLGPRGEPEPSRLQTVFEALLTQFDRLNQATEDVYRLEQRLQHLRGRGSTGPPASPPLRAGGAAERRGSWSGRLAAFPAPGQGEDGAPRGCGAGPGRQCLFDPPVPLPRRPRSSCASCASGRFSARRCAAPCLSSRAQPWAWWCSRRPTPSWPFW